MKKFTVYDPFIKNWIFFIYDCEEEEMISFIEKEYQVDVDPHYSAGRFYTLTNDKNQFDIIWVQYDIKDDFFWRTLTHELVHYIFTIHHDRGVPVNIDNDEVFAYHYEMMFYEIEQRVKEQNKRKTKRKKK